MRWKTGALGAVVAAVAVGVVGVTGVVVLLGAVRKGRVEPMPALPTLQIPPAVLALAERSLAEMRSAPPELAATFGLATAGEAQQARLGTPVREFTVPLNALKAYAPGTPAANLLTGGTTYSFPVLAGAALRSSVRLTVDPGTAPKVLGLGGTEVFAQLDRLPELAARLRGNGTESLMAVRVPALGLYFAGRRVGSKLQLSSLFDVPNEGLRSGVWEDAEAVLGRLVPSARALPEGAM